MSGEGLDHLGSLRALCLLVLSREEENPRDPNSPM